MNTDKLRTLLNILFMIGAIASIIIYFTVEDKHIFFYVCGTSIFLKMIEFFLRFMR